MVTVRISYLCRKLFFQGASEKFFLLKNLLLSGGSYKKFLGGLDERFFKAKAKKIFCGEN